MAIQVRRGLYINFDPNKLLTGEFAVSTDKQVVHIAFAPGVVKRLSTYEDMKADMQESLQEIINNLTVGIKQATDNANSKATLAEQKAMLADAKAILADQKAQQAQAIVDSASIIINKDLQASYADKATGMNGTFITCPVADDGLLHIKEMSGETVQKVTVQGKNFYDNQTTKNQTINERGVISSSTTRLLSDLISINSIQPYTYNTSNAECNIIGYAEYDSSKTFIKRVLADTKPLTFTVELTTKYIRLYFSHVVNTTVITNVLTEKVQLELGSTATTPEPFTPNSPSPEYPSTLEYAKEFDVYSICNNIFNINSDYAKSNDITNIEIYSDKITVYSNNTISYSNVTWRIDVNMVKGKKVVFSHGSITSDVSGLSQKCQLQVTADGKNTYYQSTSSGVIVDIPLNATVVLLKLLTNDISTVPNKTNVVTVTGIQLEFNEKRTYNSYKGMDKKTISFPFISVPSGIKNGKEYVDGVFCDVERIKEIIFDGSPDEYWNQTNTTVAGKYRYQLLLPEAVNSDLDINGMNSSCSHLKLLNNGGTYSANVGYTIGSNRINVYLDGMDLPSFRTWLSQNPITLQYALTTPIITPTDEIYLETNKGTTHLFTNSSPQVQLTADFKSELWSRDYLQDVALKSKFSANSEIEFTEATSDVDIATKDMLPTLFGKILKSIKTLRSGLALKFDKSNIVLSDTVGGTDKVPSAEVTKALGLEIDAINLKIIPTTYETDLNNTTVITGSYNANTLNTPYKQGLTTKTIGTFISTKLVGGTAKVQIAMEYMGTGMFMRSDNGTWSDISSNKVTANCAITSETKDLFNFSYIKNGRLYIDVRVKPATAWATDTSRNLVVFNNVGLPAQAQTVYARLSDNSKIVAGWITNDGTLAIRNTSGASIPTTTDICIYCDVALA